MSRSLVTGASGFVGSHLVDRLLADGEEVIGFDALRGPNLDEAVTNPRFRFVEGDVRDARAIDELLDDGIDVVYHLAAVVGVRTYISDPMSVIDVNVIGTRNVLTAAERHRTRVLLTSTSEVYGRNLKVPWDEDDDRVLGSTRVDRWSYSTSKAICEHMAFAMHRHRGVPATVVRFFNVYGPRQAPIYVVSQSVHRVLRGERPFLYDEGDQTRCFTYVGDAVDGTIRAARHADAPGEAFNIGSPVESTVRDVINTVLAEAASDLRPERFDSTRQYGATYEDIPRRVPSVTKADRILDWRITTDLASGVRQTIAWARAHPDWLARTP